MKPIATSDWINEYQYKILPPLKDNTLVFTKYWKALKHDYTYKMRYNSIIKKLVIIEYQDGNQSDVKYATPKVALEIIKLLKQIHESGYDQDILNHNLHKIMRNIFIDSLNENGWFELWRNTTPGPTMYMGPMRGGKHV